MAVHYRIYADGGTGVIDYTAPIGDTAALTFDTDPLDPDLTHRFAVRAYDTMSGLEEQNVDAVAVLSLDSLGEDVTGRPNAPANLAVRATEGGGARASWTYSEAGQGGAPTGFRVWLTAGGSVNYAASPDATVPYSPGLSHYSADLTGLADGSAYSVGVRAYNATAEESNTSAVASVTGDSTGPAAVSGLAGTAAAGG